MKISFSGLLTPTNETISCPNIPWRRAPCQAGNRTVTAKGNIFEVFSNRLCVAKIVVFAYKAIEDLLKGSSPYLLKLDGKQIGKITMNWRFIDVYPGGFLSLCKRVGRGEFSGRQFNEAFRFQEKQKTSADHVLQDAIRLPPAPLPANFLRNETPAFFRMRLNNPVDGCYIVRGD